MAMVSAIENLVQDYEKVDNTNEKRVRNNTFCHVLQIPWGCQEVLAVDGRLSPTEVTGTALLLED